MKPDSDYITEGLRARGHNIDVHAFESLGSTNDWLAQSDVSSALCVTDHQPAGKGRRGRVWEATAGNITFSIVRCLPIPADRLSLLSLVTGIACCEALRSELDLGINVKWPNDLLIDGSKIGGLLLEAARRGGRHRVIGGIGVNLLRDEHLGTLGIGGTYLAAHGASADQRDKLVEVLAAAVLDAWEMFASAGWSAFVERWDAVDALKGKSVNVFSGLPGSDDSAGFSGEACGIDIDGALQVRTSDGEIKRVHAGDVSVRPQS